MFLDVFAIPTNTCHLQSNKSTIQQHTTSPHSKQMTVESCEFSLHVRPTKSEKKLPPYIIKIKLFVWLLKQFNSFSLKIWKSAVRIILYSIFAGTK